MPPALVLQQMGVFLTTEVFIGIASSIIVAVVGGIVYIYKSQQATTEAQVKQAQETATAQIKQAQETASLTITLLTDGCHREIVSKNAELDASRTSRADILARYDASVARLQQLNDRIHEMQGNVIERNTTAIQENTAAMRSQSKRLDDALALTHAQTNDIIDRLSDLTGQVKPSTLPEWKPSPSSERRPLRRSDPPE